MTFVRHAIFAAFVALALTSSADPERPDIVFILIDSIRASHMGCYGYARDTTPFLDKFASQEAVRFDTVIAGGSWTQPAVMTLFSSWTADRHMRVLPQRPHRKDVVTMAQALNKAGYRTVGLTANAMTNHEFGYGKGFDVWDDYSAAMPPGSLDEVFGLRSANGEVLTRLGLNRLKRRDGDKPVFLFIFYMDPHWEFVPPAPYDRKYSQDGRLPPIGIWKKKANEVPQEMRARTVDAYDAEIAFCDHAVSNLISQIAASPRGDKTIFAVMGDHGEGFWERGYGSHGNNLYDDELAVPLIIRPPRGDGSYKPGAVVKGTVGAIDVAPTILDLAGVGIPDVWEGISRKSLLRGGTVADAKVVSETRIAPEQGWMRSVRTNRWKIIAVEPFESPCEVYDLVADPGETHNLADGQGGLPSGIEDLVPLLKPLGDK